MNITAVSHSASSTVTTQLARISSVSSSQLVFKSSRSVVHKEKGLKRSVVSVRASDSIHSLSQSIKNGDRSASEIVEQYISQMESREGVVRAFLHSDASAARASAATVDAARVAGETLGLLAGIPIAIKDNIVVHGAPTTCASNILASYNPPYDAACVSKLKAAGAVLIGKTNMDEFGMGSTTESSAFQVTTNPWDSTRVPGGSSGGSAAAVAAHQCVAALGTDTGGSIRQPASFCGVVGLKPTYGRISRHGLVAYSSSLDVIGPLARSVKDAAMLLQVIAGEDSRDATSAPAKVDDYVGGLVDVDELASQPLAGKTLGLITETMGEGVDQSVKEAIMNACKHYESLGATIKEVSLPTFKLGLPAYYVIAPSEASSNLSRYDGVRYGVRGDGDDLGRMYGRTREQGFGDEVKRRILMGTYTLSAGYYDAYYKRAQQVRTLVSREMNAALAEVDALVSPAAPTPAYPLGDKITDPLAMYAGDLMTINVNLAGLPAIVVPCGLSTSSKDEGMPIGIQLVGQSFAELELLQLAHAYELTSDWNSNIPSGNPLLNAVSS